MLSQLRDIDYKVIGKVCRNNGGYQNAYDKFAILRFEDEDRVYK